MAEQNTEQTVMVRQVTDVHSNWSYQGELEHGKFSYQLILDEGPYPRRGHPLLGHAERGPRIRQDKVIRGHRDVWARAPIGILALPPKTTSPRGCPERRG